MDLMITVSVAIISICCVIVIKVFLKDERHDLEISAGKFHFSIKKHD